ncbi:MAG: hypothetical protein GXO30_02665 [Epsilonproteobacteria bacterium]|nr:hypothetical protein [Campylobacterota bacterium]
MKKTVLFFLLYSSIFAFEHKTELSLEFNGYNTYKNESNIQGVTKLGFENEYFKTDISLEYLYSQKYRQKRYIMLNELYLSHETDDYTLKVGKSIKFIGELEGYNITDFYNQKNYLKDPFDKSAKLGSLGADFTYYFEDSYIMVGLKLYEQDIKYPTKEMPYNPFEMPYSKELQLQDKRYTPSCYLMYSFTTQKHIDSDSKIIFYHGYDNKRYFDLQNSTLSQYAYRVNKLLFLSNLVYQDYIFKTELSYTDVINSTKMSDYAQLSFGLERGFYDVFGTDITLYSEYYKYSYKDNSKIKNVDVSEIYDNDIFVALKLDMNNEQSSNIKLGMLYDLSNSERVYKVEFNSRVFDDFVIDIQYLQTQTKLNTLLTNIGNTKKATLSISYIF